MTKLSYRTKIGGNWFSRR